ncbi:MAG: hypothetical protein ACOVMN_05630 [Flexibacteraceae bacterium]
MLERALKAVLKNGVLGVFTLAMLLVFTTGCSRKVYNANPSLIGESQIDDLSAKETPTRHIDAYGYLNLPPDSPLPIVIYTYKPNDYLVGSPCAREYMLERGYLYISKDDHPNRDIDEVKMWFIIKRAEWKVFWRNGPGWKKRLRKHLKQCKASSGDFVG